MPSSVTFNMVKRIAFSGDFQSHQYYFAQFEVSAYLLFKRNEFSLDVFLLLVPALKHAYSH